MKDRKTGVARFVRIVKNIRSMREGMSKKELRERVIYCIQYYFKALNRYA